MSAPSRPAPVWHRLAREMAREGATVTAIATEFDEPYDVVVAVVLDDLDPRQRQVVARRVARQERDAAIVAMFRSGAPLAEIAQEFGVGTGRIAQIAADAGCAPRIRCNRVRRVA